MAVPQPTIDFLIVCLFTLVGLLASAKRPARRSPYKEEEEIGNEMEWTPNPHEYGGRMKSHLLLWKEVAEELGDRCGVNTSRDIETVSVRFEHESDAFMRMTLPDFCKDFERGLEQGRISPDLFSSFKKRGMIPVFLQGFMEKVFDPSTGVLIEDADTESVYAIRQLTLLFSKVDDECTDARNKAAYSAFLDAEQDVRSWTNNTPLSGENLHRFKVVSALLFGNLFDTLNREVAEFKLIPKHSSGATANRLMGNQKFDNTVWTQRLEAVFPSSDYLIPSHRFYKNLTNVELLEPGDEMPVKVITVPKTMKSPRIIAIEPAHMQYAQQGILDAIVRNWKSDVVASQFIQWDDQETNRLLAQAASHLGHLATLDLSEASDRVPLSVVSEMLTPWPDLKDAVMASRSLTANVPGYGVIPLSKFASMGSALCFPMEAFVFLTAVFMGIERATGTNISSTTDFTQYKMSVRVYGDDLIVPVDAAPSVIHVLERVFPFKVNVRKSFWNGKFRESCGGDYYDGVDVSVVRVRSKFPESRADHGEIVSYVSLRNQLYMAGLWVTARKADAYIDKMLGGRYPTVKDTSSALGRHTLLPVETLGYDRVNPTLHRPEVKAMKVRSKLPRNPLDGEGALLKFFLKRGETPYEEGHLARSGRSLGVSIQPGWAPLA